MEKDLIMAGPEHVEGAPWSSCKLPPRIKGPPSSLEAFHREVELVFQHEMCGEGSEGHRGERGGGSEGLAGRAFLRGNRISMMWALTGQRDTG